MHALYHICLHIGENTMPTRAKTERFVHPLDAAEQAIQEARKLTQKIYCIETVQALAEHNMDGLVPALVDLLAWAKQIKKDANHLEAKKISAELWHTQEGHYASHPS